ncbi:MAG: DUF3160 domain-containing protein [Lachnospiraceae bacterium]|nr:DUF3160 domain-containing protein [Lachnospiraceae bacterium]
MKDNGRWQQRILGGAMCLVLLLTSACGAKTTAPAADPGVQTAAEPAPQPAGQEEKPAEPAAVPESKGGTDAPFARPVLYTGAETAEEAPAAKVPDYQVAPDLSNVENATYDEFSYLPESWKKQLADDGFIVSEYGEREFFEVYEWNRYMMTPNYVTVDSMMHTYHLYFAYLMKTIERETLFDKVSDLTDRMLDISLSQLEVLRAVKDKNATAQEMFGAAERNTAFFAVAKALLETGWKPANEPAIAADEAVLAMADAELALVRSEAGIGISPLSGQAQEMEDYTQYKPRGYYDTDEKLQRYFRAMMWYGRRNFKQSEASSDMSALLMTIGMDDAAYADWADIYAVTSFFAGTSDDNGLCEYQPLVKEAYGKTSGELNRALAETAADEKGWESFHALTAKLDPPAINSVPMEDDDGATDKAEENAGFRFMGQRFTLDAAIYQRLIYSNVKENPAGDNRMLPDALDVPAVLGSETAKEILKKQGAFDYQNYEQNFTELQSKIAGAPAAADTASLYAGWLHTLKPLLTVKGEGYPMYMRGEKWARRALECFLGSYAELKHDTILYAKQVMAELGGGEEEVKDDRGYVEPEPVVYARFVRLARGTAAGLKELGFLSENADRDLERLAGIADKLETISRKELADEVPTEEEFEFIRCFGGDLEHFWMEARSEDAEDPSYFTSDEFPAALVADIATDPNGQVLEIANENPVTIYVIVPVDGKLKIAKGGVFSFYQFTQPIDGRLTDHEWYVMLGLEPDDNGEYHYQGDLMPEKSAWTLDYRVSYDTES